MRCSVLAPRPPVIGGFAYPAHRRPGTIAGVDASPPRLVGRTPERKAIDAALRRLGSEGCVVAIEGEPGIGKSRLLAYLADAAAVAGCTVLTARASEFEADLPYAAWTDALDAHLAGLRIERLGLADPAALAGFLPALGGEPAAADRHRIARALRDLLERLAASRPLVVCLDDLHWADPGSSDALAALLHRPPAGRVLLATAARAGQLPAAVAGGLAVALREGRATRLAPPPLSPAEAAELVGPAAASLYAASGGNPFYLEQLARGAAAGAAGTRGAGDGSVPPVVAAALEAELARLAPESRDLLEAAAVAGDPFEPGLAAAVAELAEPEALDALDALLAEALVRPGDGPRSFAFRHPVVRHAVHAAIPAGRRLAAHARAAAALEARGAGAIARAHHVEQSAAPGDQAAIALLREAAVALRASAPSRAARLFAGALRLQPPGGERSALQAALADAQAAAGDHAAAHATLVEALRDAPAERRLALTVAAANAEWGLGRNEDARRRLQVALADLPAAPSPDRIRLRLALALTALSAGELDDAHAQATDARADADAIGDPAFAIAGRCCAAVARACLGRGTEDLDGAATALEALSGDERATRLPAFWMLARAERAGGRHVIALGHLERGAAIAAETGRESVLLMLALESVPALLALGRVPDALAAAEEGVERARLAANPDVVVWALCARARARLLAGDVAGALGDAEDAGRTGGAGRFQAPGEPGWVLGAALTAAGNAARGAAVLAPVVTAVPPVDRPSVAADLAAARLAAGDVDGAATALEGAGGPDADLARSAVALARGDTAGALAAALAALGAAPPLAASRARLAEGRALAATADRSGAVACLAAAEREFAGSGALRLRDEATRELRELGHRVVRPARDGGDGVLGPLTAREREIAELVAAGRTNREIAEQLVLSARTIDAHLRNVFAKLEVRSRVELARVVARDDG
jgi:DNA-binding CsgD family transcriptional regulator